MNEKVRCKRCNRVLTNKESIKLGFGKRCYSLILQEKENKQIPSSKLENEVQFLKCEINMLKRELKGIKSTNSIAYRDEPIERIKQDESNKIVDPVVKQYREAFRECISELKDVLKSRKEKIDNIIADSMILDVSEIALMN